MNITNTSFIEKYRQDIGDVKCKRSHQKRNKETQDILNSISDSQHYKTPHHVSPLTLLFYMSLLSAMTKGKNAVLDMPCPARAGDNPINTMKVCGFTSKIIAANKSLSPFTPSYPTPSPPPLFKMIQNTLALAYPNGAASQAAAKRVSSWPFPGADGSNVRTRLIPWLPMNSAPPVPRNPTLAIPLDAGDVEIKKIDFSCFESRSEILLSDVLSKIADTLQNPATEITRETQILISYANNLPCPTQEEVDNATEIAKNIDDIISLLGNLFPQFNELNLAQKIIAPMLRMIADDMKNKKMNEIEIEDLNSEILSFSKTMIDSTLKQESHFPSDETLSIPKGMFFKNNYFHVRVNNQDYLLTQHDGEFFATRQGVIHSITYLEDEGAWKFSNKKPIVTYKKDEDPFFSLCSSRPKRGNNMGIMCSSPIENAVVEEHHSPDQPHPAPTASHTHNTQSPFSRRQQRIINRLNIGLQETSPQVDKMHFFDAWEIYRVRPEQGSNSGYYHAIKMNGQLIPVRAISIDDYHLHCEIYDIKNSQSGYPVLFYQGKWWFERSTSIHVSSNLKDNILPTMFETGINSRQLSTPDVNGLKWDASGNAYLKINDRFVKVTNPLESPTIQSTNNDRFYLKYIDEKYHFTEALLKNEYLAVTAEQFRMDKHMNSADGLNVNNNKQLNENWHLLSTNVKASRLIDPGMVGSKIDVTFKVRYDAAPNNRFNDIPTLQWQENIKFKGGDRIWHFSSDMYSHNRNSRTFFSWNNKYVEAYHFSKVEDKNLYHGMVKMYKRDMHIMEPNDLPHAETNEEKIIYVKNFLSRQGGHIEITITDVPQLRVNDVAVNKERVINFAIGFDNESVVKFNQGISLSENEFEHIFVTTSDNINLVHGDVNAFPPASVANKRLLK